MYADSALSWTCLSHDPVDCQLLLTSIIEIQAHTIITSDLSSESAEFHFTLGDEAPIFLGAVLLRAIIVMEHLHFRIIMASIKACYFHHTCLPLSTVNYFDSTTDARIYRGWKSKSP